MMPISRWSADAELAAVARRGVIAALLSLNCDGRWRSAWLGPESPRGLHEFNTGQPSAANSDLVAEPRLRKGRTRIATRLYVPRAHECLYTRRARSACAMRLGRGDVMTACVQLRTKEERET